MDLFVLLLCNSEEILSIFFCTNRNGLKSSASTRQAVRRSPECLKFFTGKNTGESRKCHTSCLSLVYETVLHFRLQGWCAEALVQMCILFEILLYFINSLVS
jgi:hypothetical protein